jgi:uncharacterized membrane protein
MRTVVLLRSFAFGTASGLRTMTGLAGVFRTGAWRVVLPLAAFGEYVVDLLPGTPDRTAAGALAARAIAGGLCGAAVARDAEGGAALCAAAGTVGAVAAAYAGLSARRWLAARITPVAAGILEDGVAIGIACLAARGRRGAT